MSETFGVWDRVCMGAAHMGGPVDLVLLVCDFAPSAWELGALIGLASFATLAVVMVATRLKWLPFQWHILAILAWGAVGGLARFVEEALS